MIKNIIFDLGNVLIEWRPEEYFISQGFDRQKLKTINELVFGSQLWQELDRGVITSEEVLEIVSKQRPDLRGEIDEILRKRWFEVLKPMPETEKFLYELKDAGYKIYLMSNFSLEGYRYIENKFKFLNDVDGKIISSHVKLIKPDPKIYEHILSEYSLIPEETVFIDDLRPNLDAAEVFGIKTIQFTGIDDLRAKIALFTEDI